MAEAAKIADLQFQISKLSREFDSYRKEKEKEMFDLLVEVKVAKQGNISLSVEMENKLTAVNNELEKLRKELVKLKSSTLQSNKLCVGTSKQDAKVTNSIKMVFPTVDKLAASGTFFTHAIFKEVVDVEKVLSSLKEKSKCQSFAELLPYVISLLRKYPTTSEIQLECVRLIQTFLPQKLSELTAKEKENLFETMVICLQSNANEKSIVDCCTDTLSKLEIITSSFNKSFESLMEIISNPKMSTRTKSLTIWLLNRIMSDSNENHRKIAGQMGGVEKLCELIKQQLNSPTYNSILVLSWISIRNICVGSNENSETFFSVGGMDMFHLCYEKFGDNDKQLPKVIMGMIWNLSCLPAVRQQLVSKRNFEVFWAILLNAGHNVAFSYSCAKVFCNFLSDSTLIWPLDSPTVEEAEKHLSETINKWKLNAQNYKPTTIHQYLEELKLHKSSLCDLILIWTLANLTTVDAPKYCRMLSEVGGVEILTTEIILHSNSSLDAGILAKVALSNINRWAKTTT